jgi:ketol-acid reductoisomerase
MIGSSVRSLYEKGRGFPCFVSVEQDGTGNGWADALALSRAIGATKKGAIASSVREETMMDLFAEQALWPNIIVLFRWETEISIIEGLTEGGHSERRSTFLKKPGAQMKPSAMKCGSTVFLNVANR